MTDGKTKLRSEVIQVYREENFRIWEGYIKVNVPVIRHARDKEERKYSSYSFTSALDAGE
jgi:hypothetical protein